MCFLFCTEKSLCDLVFLNEASVSFAGLYMVLITQRYIFLFSRALGGKRGAGEKGVLPFVSRKGFPLKLYKYIRILEDL